MTKSVEKTRKAIRKKKGDISALHANSRDSQMLQRAAMRDEKLTRVGAARRKMDKPLIERTRVCQAATRENKGPLEMGVIQSLITSYVHKHDEELDALKKARRAGRPASTREDLLKMKIATDVKEYEAHGFYLPDLTNTENVIMLDRWDGYKWEFLGNLKWVRVSSNGSVQPSSFPPKGQS